MADTDAGAHWRLNATYAKSRDPGKTTLEDRRVVGRPGLGIPMPEFVAIVADDGDSGYVDLNDLLDIRDLTSPDLPETEPLPVYADDGTTIIGAVTVDRPYRPAD